MIHREERSSVLAAIERSWDGAAHLPALREEMADIVASAAGQGGWGVSDLPTLGRHLQNLKSAGSTRTGPLEQLIWELRLKAVLMGSAGLIALHLAFWAALMTVYPNSPKIQAEIFWNKRVRKVLGCGYVDLLLRWSPYLRQRLFYPFTKRLVLDADPDDFDEGAYFPESHVTYEEQGVSKSVRIIEAISQARGHIVLEGDSGLGKSFFMRRLVKQSSRLKAYILANECAEGVLSAVQLRLTGAIADAEFLQALMYRGAIDVYVDGLNEVSADTRAKVTQFVEGNPFCTVLIGTQPLLDWSPPIGSRVYRLQPLDKLQIEKFLLHHSQALEVTGSSDFACRCHSFVVQALDEQQPKEYLDAVVRILSNPMDLTVVAQMLTKAQNPDLLHLQDQQFQIMAAAYSEKAGRPYPLMTFAEDVYEMRKTDATVLPSDRWPDEVSALYTSKMVIRRFHQTEGGGSVRHHYFRHDKIAEYFILQTFLGADNQRIEEHLDDARFRGVYFLLATQLPVDAATALREKLILHAARTNDNSISNRFVQLVSTRKMLESSGPEWVTSFEVPGVSDIEKELRVLGCRQDQVQHQIEDLERRLDAVRSMRGLLFVPRSDELQALAAKALQDLGGFVLQNSSGTGVTDITDPRERRWRLWSVSSSTRLDSLPAQLLTDDPSSPSWPICVAITQPSIHPDARPAPFDEECVRLARKRDISLLTGAELFRCWQLSRAGNLINEGFWDTLFAKRGVADLIDPSLDSTLSA